MKHKGAAFWIGHVEALKREAMAASAYAQLHGISVKRLYYWQRKLHESVVERRAIEPETFVAVRVAQSEAASEVVEDLAGSGCSLVFESGLRLEMSSLPAPAWLAALARAAQGAR